jgi:hypothetical protein
MLGKDTSLLSRHSFISGLPETDDSSLWHETQYHNKSAFNVWHHDIQNDSKLLSKFPWPINGNPDNNLEPLCISNDNVFFIV